jgi:signal transduction histidine kinase
MGTPTWLRRHRVVLDVALAITFALIDTGATLAGNSWWPARPGALAWAMLGVQVLADLSLVARRRAPMVVIAVLAGYTLAISLLISPAHALTPAHSGNVWAPIGTVVAAYGPFYYSRSRVAAFAAVGALTLIVARVWDPSASVITIGVLRTVLGPLLALYFTARYALVQALRERAARAERESRVLAEQARADERARLAGEMHDVVTHRVSLMVLHAGALSVSAPDEGTRQAAEELRSAGCQALEELRDLVGILQANRTGEDRTGEELPSPAGLAELIAESTAVGTPADLLEEGDPALASPVVGRTAYRIVREALTNVRKHAPGARTHVRVSYGSSLVTVKVTNEAAAEGSEGSLASSGSGLGLASLRRRVELVRGTLDAGITADGGFCLEATLPAYVPTAEPVA